MDLFNGILISFEGGGLYILIKKNANLVKKKV